MAIWLAGEHKETLFALHYFVGRKFPALWQTQPDRAVTPGQE